MGVLSTWHSSHPLTRGSLPMCPCCRPAGLCLPLITTEAAVRCSFSIRIHAGLRCWLWVIRRLSLSTGVRNTRLLQFPPQATSGTAASSPPVPSGLTATAGNALVDLAWFRAGRYGALSYNVYFSLTSGGSDSLLNTDATVTGNSYAAIGLTNGTPYYFVVTSVNAGGESAHSLEVNATPLASLAPAPPGGVTTLAGNNQVTISWAAVTGATSYKVYQSTSSDGFGSRSRLDLTCCWNVVYRYHSCKWIDLLLQRHGGKRKRRVAKQLLARWRGYACRHIAGDYIGPAQRHKHDWSDSVCVGDRKRWERHGHVHLVWQWAQPL